jgi:hypothetical protein
LRGIRNEKYNSALREGNVTGMTDDLMPSGRRSIRPAAAITGKIAQIACDLDLPILRGYVMVGAGKARQKQKACQDKGIEEMGPEAAKFYQFLYTRWKVRRMAAAAFAAGTTISADRTSIYTNYANIRSREHT